MFMMGTIFGYVVTSMLLTTVSEQCQMDLSTLRRDQNSAHTVKLSGPDFRHHTNCVCGNQKGRLI
jgi:hypothetical protein